MIRLVTLSPPVISCSKFRSRHTLLSDWDERCPSLTNDDCCSSTRLSGSTGTLGAWRKATRWTADVRPKRVRFLAFSRCRLSEVRRVTWADVDFDCGHIVVRSAKVRRTSNASESRFVPIIPAMRKLLPRLQAGNTTSSDRVCVLGECEKSLTRACERVGIPRITHHDLRHLFATRCIGAGVDIPTVSRWLGHSDRGALAMRTYGHMRQQHSQAMAQRVPFSLSAKSTAPPDINS